MDEDMLRILCLAIRKASDGKPVAIADEELDEGFELKIKAGGDGVVVQILPED